MQDQGRDVAWKVRENRGLEPSFDDAEGEPRRVRTLFLSDVHLGCRFAQVEQLLSFLDAHEPERLYIVGDLVDGWRLRRKWRWSPACGEVLERLVALAHRGCEVLYTPGNHDDFLRDDKSLLRVLRAFDFVRIRDEFVHETADGRNFLVTHGDLFDGFETKARWFSKFFAGMYDWLLAANRVISRATGRSGAACYATSAAVKSAAKRFIGFLGDFEGKLSDRAEELGCDGVICGHVHTPTIARRNGLTYCNTGDWVEHCSALLESADGRLEVVLWQGPEAGRAAVRRTLFAEPTCGGPHGDEPLGGAFPGAEPHRGEIAGDESPLDVEPIVPRPVVPAENGAGLPLVPTA